MDERGLKALSLAVRYGEDADLAFEAIALEEKRELKDFAQSLQKGETAICNECGCEFTKKTIRQRFCSPKCHRKYYHRQENRHTGVHRLPKPGEPILREFQCKNCGCLVQVVDRRDQRKKFCSQECEKYYWKDKYLRDKYDSRGSKNKRRRKR